MPKSLHELDKSLYDGSCCQDKKSKREDRMLKIGYGALPVVKYAHFHMPLYRFPFSLFITVFLPLWILGILNVSTFYSQDENLTTKIDNVANILFAYFTLLELIRQVIPKRPNLTVLEVMIYTQMFTPFLTIIQGIYQ